MTMLTSPKRHFLADNPLPTHWRLATCREVDCPHYLLGWQTVVGSASPQAEYIRRESGRRLREERHADGLSRFVFEAGQKCFRQHKIQIGLPTIFSQRRNGTAKRQEFDRWQGEFQEHLDDIRILQKRG